MRDINRSACPRWSTGGVKVCMHEQQATVTLRTRHVLPWTPVCSSCNCHRAACSDHASRWQLPGHLRDLPVCLEVSGAMTSSHQGAPSDLVTGALGLPEVPFTC